MSLADRDHYVVCQDRSCSQLMHIGSFGDDKILTFKPFKLMCGQHHLNEYKREDIPDNQTLEGMQVDIVKRKHEFDSQQQLRKHLEKQNGDNWVQEVHKIIIECFGQSKAIERNFLKRVFLDGDTLTKAKEWIIEFLDNGSSFERQRK